MKKLAHGLGLCLLIAIPCAYLGHLFPVVGGPVFGIVIGALIAQFFKIDPVFDDGIQWVSKKILQLAVIFLGFGLNLNVVLQTGAQSLPIIISTIATSLIIAYLLKKVMHIPANIATLVGVGSSICGGSAIAATAPVIKADDEDVAQAMSVIFFFNLVAALTFPALGAALGFNTSSGDVFGIFAGTAINDTSSVTAAAATWDTLYGLGSQTLDKAVTVKLTRTLAIIPITLVLGIMQAKKEEGESTFSLKKAFPTFILFFMLASIITTVLTSTGVSAQVFIPFKDASKFMIVLAMTAIGLKTDLVKLIKTGGKPLTLGFCCWIGIITVSLVFQKFMGLW